MYFVDEAADAKRVWISCQKSQKPENIKTGLEPRS